MGSVFIHAFFMVEQSVEMVENWSCCLIFRSSSDSDSDDAALSDKRKV